MVTSSDGKNVPISPERLLGSIHEETGGWPKVTAGSLVCEDNGIRYLKNSDALFAWLHKRFDAAWLSGSGSISKREFFEYAVQNSETFDDITEFPHFPRLAHMLYQPMPELRSSGGRLDDFLVFGSTAKSVVQFPPDFCGLKAYRIVA